MKKFIILLLLFMLLSKVSFAAEEMPWHRELLTNIGVELIEDEKITRGEFVTMALQLFGYTEEDLKSEKMIEDFPSATIYLAKLNLDLWGYPDGTFRPYEYIKYEEAVKILCMGVMQMYPSDLRSRFVMTWPNEYIQLADALGVLDGIEYELGEEVLTSDAEKLLVKAAGMISLKWSFGDERYLTCVVPFGTLYYSREVFQRHDTLSNIIAENDVEVLCTVPDETKKYNFYIEENTNRIFGCEPISEQEVCKRYEIRKNFPVTAINWFGYSYVNPYISWPKSLMGPDAEEYL